MRVCQGLARRDLARGGWDKLHANRPHSDVRSVLALPASVKRTSDHLHLPLSVPTLLLPSPFTGRQALNEVVNVTFSSSSFFFTDLRQLHARPQRRKSESKTKLFQ